MKALYLCGGGGGGSLGGLSLGIDPILNVDKNPTKPSISHSIANSYKLNLNSAVREQTLEEFAKDLPSLNISNLDFIVASLPCLNFSMANQIKGESMEDFYMAEDTAKIIDYYYPDNVILENVPKWLKSKAYEHLRDRLLGKGYYVEESVLDASNYSVPATRKRAIVRASLGKKTFGDVIPTEKTLWPSLVKHHLTGKTTKPHPSQVELISSYPDGMYVVEKRRGKFSQKIRGIKESVFTCTSTVMKTRSFNVMVKHNNFLTCYDWSWEFAKALMTFPGEYVLPEPITHKGILLGQSIPPMFAKAIFKSFL